MSGVMEGLDEEYIENISVNKVVNDIKNLHLKPARPSSTQPSQISRSPSFQLPLNNVTSEPTTSISMDQTICQVSATPTSLTPVITPSATSEIQTPISSLGRHRQFDSNANEPFSRDGGDDALLESMSQSIYSVAESIRQIAPPVSVDIPAIFLNKKPSATNDLELDQWDKNFFILTSAGKPIYSMHGKDEQTTSFMGIINTIINYFQVEESTEIQKIVSKRQKFIFLNRSPIILVAYSTRGETSNELTNQLDFLHSYLLSSLSQRQVSRIFDKRENFDLRNFLEATDFENLDEICSLISEKFYPDYLLGALQCLALNKTYRSQLHEYMLKYLLKESDLPRGTLLYGLIVAPNHELCSVLRPRGHTLHTTDLHLLFCLIFHQFKNLNDDQELWVPICFPKFNSNGFLYCYIKFLSSSNYKPPTTNRPVLVLISAQKDAFYQLKELGDKFIANITTNGLLDKIYQAQPIKIGDIQAPLIHHFIYKSKKHTQYVMPQLQFAARIPDPDQVQEYEKKLMTYYQQLHNSVMHDEGVPFSKSIINFLYWESSMDLFEGSNVHGFIKGEKTQMLGLVWITPTFELYLISNNGISDKRIVLRSAKKIINWCRKNHAKIFVNEGAIF